MSSPSLTKNISRIDLEVMVHNLNVSSAKRPVWQKRKSFIPERNQAVVEEVYKLQQVGFIHEVHYPEWLSNVVVGLDFSTTGKSL